jgi:hypothetical protein
VKYKTVKVRMSCQRYATQLSPPPTCVKWPMVPVFLEGSVKL